MELFIRGIQVVYTEKLASLSKWGKSEFFVLIFAKNIALKIVVVTKDANLPINLKIIWELAVGTEVTIRTCTQKLGVWL